MTTPSGVNPESTADNSSEELFVPPALRRRLQECFERAQQLMQQDSYDVDYVHTMLVECVIHDPGNIVYLDGFFENLHRKYNNNKRGSRLNFGGRGDYKKALSQQVWKSVLKLGPQVLKSNPWDTGVLRAMAEACAAFSLYETELRYLKNALAVKPKDAAVNRHCALSLARLGQFDQAIACWQRVDEAKSGDLEAQEMIADLQIEKTNWQKGKPVDRGKKAAAVPRKEAGKSEAELPPRREVELTPRQELEQALVLNPTDLESYIALADLHVQEGRIGEAAHVLTKALAASGNDLQIQMKLEDVEMIRQRHQVEVAEQRAAKEGSDASRQLVEQLKADLNRYELDIYDGRVQRYPTDLEIQFQLGLRLKRAGNYRQAVPFLEAAQALPTRLAGAKFELGECQQRLKQYAAAFDLYCQSADQAGPDQEPLRLLAWYRAAVLATGLGNLAGAEELLQRISAIESGYRDVAPRLDKIREMRHKG